MNIPINMFRTRQIVRHDLSVDLPDCMYRIKNIHGGAATDRRKNGAVCEGKSHVPSATEDFRISEKVKGFLQGNQEMQEVAALQDRQDKILERLAELKDQMFKLKLELKSSAPQKPQVVKCTFAPRIPDIDVSKLPEIIIKASPNHPPFCLEIVQKLLGNSLLLSVTTHLHSSVPTLTNSAIELANNLEKFTPPSQVPQLKVRLIWKEVGAQMEVIVSGTPIIGEVNILRFLARTIPILNYDSNYPFEIDSLLDISYGISKSRTKSERAAHLQIINKKLGKNEWLCGSSQITIADIAAYSAIKQTSENEVNINITKWLQRVQKVV